MNILYKKGEKLMSNKKKIILFLGAVSLIAFGNYKQFTKNKAQLQ